MRRNCILACLMVLAASNYCPGQDHAPGVSTVASFRFYSNGVGECVAAVTKFQIQATDEPREKLAITCKGKKIASFETGGNLVDWKVNYPEGDRLFARWERGTGGELTVFKISTANPPAKPIFDKWEVYVPELIDYPDVVLVYSGVRFVGALKTPTQTDVYSWDGNEYKLEESWKWDERMRYEDRFCILDAKLLNCPATLKRR
jgi:hypothetical protein